ncbi:ABC transporter ATP-binding protein [Scatolibacter rhodanostii]|uniref:ABC transporter ATP-binding protein n=1 Tax=Scatolibacter rhodanostii TaxID=2014781 RepID=UPI000C088FA7|nr:ABC transporter ATP-binding protein [Scatolibacter rhodanostii]
MAVISAYQLSKVYGDKKILSDFTIQIPEGETFGLLGPANSGKTAFLRILAGLSMQTEGECSILGLSPKMDIAKLHKMTGVVTETAKLYNHMTVDENLRFFANLNEIDADDAIDRISFLLHNLDIWQYRDTKVELIPTNAMQRAHIARALVHSPKVLLLDEPTMEMDRETTESVQYMMEHMRTQEGVTSLICTRYPEHAEMICTQLGIMKEARLIAKGDFEELRFSSGLQYEAEMRITMDSLLPIGFEHHDGIWRKAIEKEDDMPQIIADAIAHGCKIYEAKVKRPSLKQISESFISGKYLEAKVGELHEEFSEFDEAEQWEESFSEAETNPQQELEQAGDDSIE